MEAISDKLVQLKTRTSKGIKNTSTSVVKGVKAIQKDPTSKEGSNAIVVGVIVICILLIFVYVLFIRNGGVFSWGGGSGGGSGGTSPGKNEPDTELGKADDPPTVEQLILYGQSLSIGVNSQPMMSMTQPNPENVFTLSGGPIGDGPGLVPLHEVKTGSRQGETPASALGNAYFMHYLKGQKNRKVIVGAYGEGSMSVVELSTPPLITRYKTRAETVFDSSKKKFPDAKVVKQPVICWVQGEADRSSTLGAYKSSLANLISDLEQFSTSVGSKKAKFLSYQTSYGSADNSPVMEAQMQLHNEGKMQIVTPIYHFPLANDGIHLSGRGSQMLGAYFARAANCVRRGWKVPLTTPISAKVEGGKVIVKFDVPTRPLKFSSAVSAVNQGFEISGATISNVALGVGGDEVVIEGSGFKTGQQLRYALTKHNRNKIATGTVVDSCKETVPIGPGGADVMLENYAPHFSMILQ